MSSDSSEPPQPRPPPRMAYRRHTPPSYTTTLLRTSISNDSATTNSSIVVELGESKESSIKIPIRDFADRMGMIPGREEDTSLFKDKEFGTIIHDENILSSIMSFSGITPNSEDTNGASDPAIEVMDERGLSSNIHEAARWLMSNASPQCLFFQKRTERRIAALCVAMLSQDCLKRMILSMRKILILLLL